MASKLAEKNMSGTVQKAIAGAAESPVADNVSEQEYVLRRQAAKEQAKPAPEAVKPEEEKPKEAESEAAPEDSSPKAKDNDVLSKAKTNLDDLSAEELDQLAKELGSKAVARFGELTAKRKAAEERAASLEAALARQSQEKAAPADPVINNPFASIKDAAELQSKAKEIKEVIEFAEEKLDDADGIGMDEVAAVVDGKEYTKRQLRDTLRKARKAEKEYLPDVARRLQTVEQAKQLRESLNEQMRKQLPWMEDEGDERKKRYDAMASDPRLKRIEEVAPDIAAQMPFLLAHASNSMYARREIPIEAKPAVKATPPENPSTGAATSRSPEGVKSKQEKELKSRLVESGAAEDWLALRTAQISKRKTIA